MEHHENSLPKHSLSQGHLEDCFCRCKFILFFRCTSRYIFLESIRLYSELLFANRQLNAQLARRVATFTQKHCSALLGAHTNMDESAWPDDGLRDEAGRSAARFCAQQTVWCCHHNPVSSCPPSYDITLCAMPASHHGCLASIPVRFLVKELALGCNFL